MSAAAGLRRIGAFIQAWLLGRGLDRGRSSRGRWLHVGLTVMLLVTGLAAWALALVQPWKAQASDPGIVAARGQPAPQRVRAAAQEAEKLLEHEVVPALPTLGRNPFKTPGWAEAPRGASGPALASPGGPASPGTGPVTAEQVAETVRGLTLKATVRSTRGERWAVINEKAYREGDEVAGLTLVEIGEDRAMFRRAGVTCVLKMD